MKSIKCRRAALGITQVQMAARFGVSQSTIVLWESDGSYPRPRFLPAIAEYLHCTVDDLFAAEQETAVG